MLNNCRSKQYINFMNKINSRNNSSLQKKSQGGFLLSLMLTLCYILVFQLFSANAQTQKTTPKLSKVKISYITPDSSFSINFRFRMQNRFLMNSISTEDLNPGSWEARVRRTRLSFTGHIYDPRLTYYLQLSFSRGDMDWSMQDSSGINTSPNAVRDAMIFYKPTKNLQLGFGQGKLPGNRQRVVSSGSQQFYDRSVANATLTIDRDFGFFANYSMHAGKFKTILKGAISSGEGRNSVISNSGLAYTGRVELLPFGDFTDGGDYFEGDLLHEQKPKLSLAGGYHFNDQAVRTQGQLGKDLYTPVSLNEILLDGLFKFKGWALSAEYMNRKSEVNPVTVNTANKKRAALIADGYNLQLSYCTKSQWELAGRYSKVTPDSKVQAYYNQLEQYGLGLTRYFIQHKVKAQFNVFYNNEKNLVTNKDVVKNMFAVFQIELGI